MASPLRSSRGALLLLLQVATCALVLVVSFCNGENAGMVQTNVFGKCKPSEHELFNRAIRDLCAAKPNLCFAPTFADWVYCLASPSRGERQREILSQSTKDKPAPCKIKPGGKYVVHLERLLWKNVRSDPAVQCLAGTTVTEKKPAPAKPSTVTLAKKKPPVTVKGVFGSCSVSRHDMFTRAIFDLCRTKPALCFGHTFVDWVYCLSSPSRGEKELARLRKSRHAKPAACRIEEDGEYVFHLEQELWKNIDQDQAVRCLTKRTKAKGKKRWPYDCSGHPTAYNCYHHGETHGCVWKKFWKRKIVRKIGPEISLPQPPQLYKGLGHDTPNFRVRMEHCICGSMEGNDEEDFVGGKTCYASHMGDSPSKA